MGEITEIIVRPARASDLPALTDLYNHYVLNSHVTFDMEPFSVEARRAWFDHYHETGPHRLLVAVRDDGIAGYASSSPLRPKPGYSSSVETSVYIHPEHLGLRIGNTLYSELFRLLSHEEGLHRAYAGVALPNDASIALHRKHGFHELGLFHEVGHKFGRYWSVQWFERPLP